MPAAREAEGVRGHNGVHDGLEGGRDGCREVRALLGVRDVEPDGASLVVEHERRRAPGQLGDYGRDQEAVRPRIVGEKQLVEGVEVEVQGHAGHFC